jgi:hypothetical protein
MRPGAAMFGGGVGDKNRSIQQMGQVTWIYNLGLLCNQLGQVLEKQGQEWVSHIEEEKKKNGKGKRKWPSTVDDNEQRHETNLYSAVGNELSNPSLAKDTLHHTTFQEDEVVYGTQVSTTEDNYNNTTTTAAQVATEEEPYPVDGTMAETESEGTATTDNENIVASQQSMMEPAENSIPFDQGKKSTPRKAASTKWKKERDDQRLIQAVLKIKATRTVRNEKQLIQLVVEELNGEFSEAVVRKHYRRLLKEKRLPGFYEKTTFYHPLVIH